MRNEVAEKVNATSGSSAAVDHGARALGQRDGKSIHLGSGPGLGSGNRRALGAGRS